MNNNTKTGFCILWSLVFYFSFAGCTEKKNPGSAAIQWDGDKAIGIIVPPNLLSSVPKDSVKELVRIHLGKSNLPVIGDYLTEDNQLIFKPMIAFTRGLNYKLYIRNELVEEIEIPVVNSAAPQVIAVYPVLDTVPANLLKFYISFSKPMQQGEVLSHIHLIKDGRDTLSSVFLDLELWNNEKTMMTLWLDPGRIKRELQPNKRLGPPLIEGSNYQLAIDKNWQDAEGILLKENYTKNFFTAARDSLSPDEQVWTIDVPKAGTQAHLRINFHESLDYVLAENTISIADANGKKINGEFRANDRGSIVYFLAEAQWKPGNYILQIESRLEDLAGNNLDRLFDTDLTKKQQTPKKVHTREFAIR